MRSDALSTTFAALGDPTRRAILTRLAFGEATVTELAKQFDMSFQRLWKHVKVLEVAGLVAKRRDARRRPCRLEPAPLHDVATWVQQYRIFWDEGNGRVETAGDADQVRCWSRNPDPSG